jgi:chromosome segregation ATPase
MTEETLPNALEAVADAPQAPETTEAQHTDKPEGEKPEGKDDNPLEKQLKREQRRIQNLTRQKYELQARLEQLSSLAPSTQKADNQGIDDDSDTLSLSKAELQRMIEQKAKELAPTIKAKEDGEAEIREKAISLRKTLGDRFEELTSDLATVFDHDRQMLVLDADNPAALIEYLTDPDNADEADRIARLPANRAAFAMARIEAKLASTQKPKPQPSKVAAPIEPVRGGGGASNAAPDVIKDPAGWRRWMNAQGL